MDSPAAINVLVADDHTLFRKGTQMLVKQFPEVAEAYEAENGQEALRMLAENPIDLVLLDLDMPVMDGWQAARKIVNRYPDVYIIMVSMNEDLKTISDLIEIGVHSYLPKNAQPEEMQRAIQGVLENQFYYNQLVSNALQIRADRQAAVAERDQLSVRELEVIEMICREFTMREIAEQLSISEQTVMTHRKNLMKKIQVNNSVGIVRYAIQSSIVSF